MSLFYDKYRIETTRLPGYDYSRDGYYFVTICTQDNKNFFGRIVNDEMELNRAGELACEFWKEIPVHFNNAILDEFIVMPNHVHGIIELDSSRNKAHHNDGVATHHSGRDVAMQRLYRYGGGHPQMSIISPVANSISTIIRSYKSICTRTINKQHLDFNFAWQERFYDHIIRNSRALHNIKNYIRNNPGNWWKDRNNKSGLLIQYFKN